MNPNFFDTTKLGYLDEDFTTFFETSQVKIERIVTRGQTSPKNFYYDQEDGEWVLILEGEAELSFSDKTSVTLKKGESLYLPPHQRHRVSTVSDYVLWLAIFIKEEPKGSTQPLL